MEDVHEASAEKSAKRRRLDVHGSESTLKKYWEQGMMGIATEHQKQLASECSVQTGLDYSQVRNWIGNYKKRLAKEQSAGHSTSSALASGSKHKSGKDVYFSEILPSLKDIPPSQRLSIAAEQWRKVKETPAGALYQQKATMYPTLKEAAAADTESSIKHTSQLHKQFVKLIGEMEAAGEEVVAVAYNRSTGDCNRFGSRRGLAFTQHRSDIMSQFIGFVGNDTMTAKLTTALRDKVCELFNKEYGKATGARRCSYRQVNAGTVAVEGMPEGIPFHHPSCYGRQKLQKILEHAESIKFTCLLPQDSDSNCQDTPSASSVSSVTSLDTACTSTSSVSPSPVTSLDTASTSASSIPQSTSTSIINIFGLRLPAKPMIIKSIKPRTSL